MAFNLQDAVSMLVSVPGSVNIQQQPPLFGIVNLVAGVDVLWQTGGLTTGIDAGSLDKIGIPDPMEASRVFGRWVQIGASGGPTTSPEYQGVVVSLYTRDPAAAGTPTATLALMRTEAGLYIELFSASLFPVTGR